MTTTGPFSSSEQMAIREHMSRVDKQIERDNRLRIEALRLATSLAGRIDDHGPSITQVAERFYRFLQTGRAPV